MPNANYLSEQTFDFGEKREDLNLTVLTEIAELKKAIPNQQNSAAKPKILLLTSSLLTDRMMLYSNFLDELVIGSQVKIWSTSYANPFYREMWESRTNIEVEEFPAVEEFRRFFNYLRRLNEFARDASQPLPSRVSMERHRRQNRGVIERKILRPFGNLLARIKLENQLENQLERILTTQIRSRAALEYLKAEKPDAIFLTAPFQFNQPAVAAVAKRLKIPVLCLIPSWDNLSTKNRMVFHYNGYVVWSEESKKQLHEFYPHTQNKPVFVTGAAQFDVFFQNAFYQNRQDFCREQNLDAQLPFIVYALGSPNFLREYDGALRLAERIKDGALGKVQMLVRPHPMFDDGKMNELFAPFAPFVRVQKVSAAAGEKSAARSQNTRQIVEWVNTFRHAAVTVNLSSTVTVDAAIFDCPVVNLDFDPQPGQPNQNLIKDINHRWTHFKPIAESGGVWLVADFAEMECAVKTYLKNPALHKEKRRWIAEFVGGEIDGEGGARMARAILDFVSKK